MAAGEHVSVSSQADTEAADLARERRELAEQPAAELDELTHFYVGVSVIGLGLGGINSARFLVAISTMDLASWLGSPWVLAVIFSPSPLSPTCEGVGPKDPHYDFRFLYGAQGALPWDKYLVARTCQSSPSTSRSKYLNSSSDIGTLLQPRICAPR